MIRTFTDTSTRTFDYEHINKRRRHVADCLTASNQAKQLKALKWKTPYAMLQPLSRSGADLFRTSPDRFTSVPCT